MTKLTIEELKAGMPEAVEAMEKIVRAFDEKHSKKTQIEEVEEDPIKKIEDLFKNR